MRTKYSYLSNVELRALLVALRQKNQPLDDDLVDEVINRMGGQCG
jgi:hypothetical protein